MEESSGQRFTRSEGLGVASIAMFEAGLFSGDSNNPYQVDGTPSIGACVHDQLEELIVDERSGGSVKGNRSQSRGSDASHRRQPHGRPRRTLVSPR